MVFVKIFLQEKVLFETHELCPCRLLWLINGVKKRKIKLRTIGKNPGRPKTRNPDTAPFRNEFNVL